METTLSLLRDFVAAQQTQQDAKNAFREMHMGEDGYADAQRAFRNADDRYEDLFTQVVTALQQAQAEDTTDEIVDALGSDADALRRILAGRGVDSLLEANADNGLAVLIRKYRKASALYTAARELNARRRSVDPADFEEYLDQPPAGVDAEAWTKVVRLLGTAEDALYDADPDAEPEDVTRDAAYAIEEKLRKRYDQLVERVVTVFRDLLDGGTFDLAVSDLEPEDRRAAYELQRVVPQPQRQTQTQTVTREVDVL
jgi:hypothetical protein